MIKIKKEIVLIEVIPWKNDFIFAWISQIGRKNPFIIGFIYFIVEFVIMYLLGYLTGQLHGKNGLAAMYSRVLDNINMGIIAPLGAGLLCNLYHTIYKSFLSIHSEGLIPSEQIDEFNNFKNRLNTLYSSKAVIVIAFIFAFSINGYNYFAKVDSWLGINGGITGLYGRFFAGLNYFILTLIIYKCAISYWALHSLLRFNIEVRPFHPDRAGGLKMIGQIAIALNYFIILVLVFFTLMLVFDEFARQQPLYLIIFLFFYPFAIIIFFTSLLGAHKKMNICKQQVIEKLGATFDFYYKKLNRNTTQNIYDLESAAEISSIDNLYQIATKMPVWPFDKESLIRAFSSLGLPFIIFLADFLKSPETISSNLEIIKNIFGF